MVRTPVAFVTCLLVIFGCLFNTSDAADMDQLQAAFPSAVFDLSKALERQRNEGKPIMVLFLSPTCPVCKTFLSAIAPPSGGAAFADASKDYIMLVQMEELDGAEWAPDGRYVPRAFFVRDGAVHHEVQNEISKFPDGSYKYTYQQEPEIVDSMSRFYHAYYAKAPEAAAAAAEIDKPKRDPVVQGETAEHKRPCKAGGFLSRERTASPMDL